VKRIIDLTHSMAPGMPYYPGTEPPLIDQAFRIAEDGYAEQRLTFLTHTGTHLDAPAHMLEGGRTLDALPVERFLGRALAVDVSGHSGCFITREHLEPLIHDLKDLAFVLMHTGWDERWGSDLYYDGFPTLDQDAAKWLASGTLHGIGVDAVSIDTAHATEFPIHRILLQSGLVIVENLKGLRELIGKRFHFCCLPLKIIHSDGAPARAVAMLD
jgi:arylformamidase